MLQQSDSVYIDLLTHADLEALKSRHAKAAAAKPNPVGKSNKRYLILTCVALLGACGTCASVTEASGFRYAVEFDRVHYPLPLTFDEQPEPKVRPTCGCVTLRRSDALPMPLAFAGTDAHDRKAAPRARCHAQFAAGNVCSCGCNTGGGRGRRRAPGSASREHGAAGTVAQVGSLLMVQCATAGGDGRRACTLVQCAGALFCSAQSRVGKHSAVTQATDEARHSIDARCGFGSYHFLRRAKPICLSQSGSCVR